MENSSSTLGGDGSARSSSEEGRSLQQDDLADEDPTGTPEKPQYGDNQKQSPKDDLEEDQLGQSAEKARLEGESGELSESEPAGKAEPSV